MSEPTNKTYTITTIADLLRVVNGDNVEALTADITGLLINAALTKALTEPSLPDGVDMFEGASITWCDDNINKQTFSAECANGEALEFVLSGPPHGTKDEAPAE